ncbi:MAG: aminotransferase class V-fold PLP-dependent enzyme [Promethearchaeia archaeon]|nr:MAG: aminotransferase class V-fold PLP-dependent enzyme [Candidatus Lokiarchaeia archaeon]
MTPTQEITLNFIRNQIIGRDYRFSTPFGSRLLTYADFTASGRALNFIEKFLIHVQRSYANTHTEDDATGRTMTGLLHQAEHMIKQAFNAENGYCIIAHGTGSTGAISKFQEIIGVRVAPATKALYQRLLEQYFEDHPEIRNLYQEMTAFLEAHKPVVFISSYEHHSNEIMWRESFAEVIEIALLKDGTLDLEYLEREISDPRYNNRLKIGSFSAASNVTGIVSPVYDIARILHRHGAIACFDFAASAPYVKINMNKDDESYFDAVFISPHKFLGGPGATGILVFNESLYDTSLPPTFAAGGTVDYVSPFAVDYTKDIETREKAGTPGIIQTIRAALAIDLKDHIGIEVLEAKERDFCRRGMEKLQKIPNVEILGNPDPDKRIPIISFVIRHNDRYLHPKFSTKLLNDLFGIQSRAGCSCAGVYGHRLLNITHPQSEKFRKLVQKGFMAIKPGWTRVNFHYSFTETEFQFIIDAIEFVAKYGYKFLPLYKIDLHTGDWFYRNFVDKDLSFRPTIQNVLKLAQRDCFEAEPVNMEKEFREYLQFAHDKALKLPEPKMEDYKTFGDPLADELQWFYFCDST